MLTLITLDDYSAIDVNGDGAFIINSNIGNAGIGVNVNGNNVNIGDNNITYSDVGVKLNGNDAVVYGNNVTNNTVGILINVNDTEIVDNYFYDNIQDISIDKNSNRNNPLYKNQLKSENYPRENISVGTDPNLEITNVTSDAIDVALPDDAKGYLLVDIDGIGYYKHVNGNVTFDVPDNLDPGVHVVDITYSGDGNYAAAATSVDLTVPKRDAYTFETIGDTVNYGENAVISIVLPDDANGTVFAIVDNIIKKAEVVNGRANITLPVLSVGEYNFTVEYSGDDNYEGSTTTAFVSITKITPDIEINITPEESDVGDTVQVIVTFPDNVANNVVVRIAGKTYSVASGEVIEITNLTAGDYDVIAIYDGDDIYYDNMNYASFKVIARQDANITIDDVEVPVGENATIEVTLTEDATGEVTVTVNGENYTVPVKDGKASVAIPELPAGNYNVTVTYSGDDNYRSSSVNSTLDVVTVYSADIVKIFHNDTQFTALFLDNNGTPLANTTVSFKINGRNYKRTTNESGWAKFNINLGPGEYDLTAINPVTGEEKLNTVTVLTNLETSDLTKYFMNASQFIVRAILPNGSYAGAGEKIRFNINGRFYARTTDDNGYAILNINLPPGEYTITTYYGDYSVGNTISVLPILTADDLVMVHGDGSKFTVKLLDGLGIGQVITFNINGVFYNRTTDSNGEAKLAINLPAGEYIITSMYNNASTSNTIKIS